MDGYRAIAVIDSIGKARIWSRNRLPLESKFPMVQEAVNKLKLRSTILDGEIVALDEAGIPRFQSNRVGRAILRSLERRLLQVKHNVVC